ncbi:MAG: hypothetical protein ABFS46_10955 [Myxococcota bacterium]
MTARRRLGSTAALAVLLLFSTSCTTWLGNVRKSLRDPGVHFRSFPEEVAEEYGCRDKPLPFFEIEKLELLPNRLRPGEEFNHRIVYVLCPKSPTAVVAGTLHTRILHRGRAIVDERDQGYEFKPGRWVVDAFVTVPLGADIGIYAMEIAFQGTDLRFTERLTFAVDAAADP